MSQDPGDARAALADAVSAAQRGSGAVVILVAPAGARAERMLADGAAQAAERGTAVVRARGRASERALPFAIAVELFEAVWTGELDGEQRAELAGGTARSAADLLDGATTAGGGDGPGDAGFSVIRGLCQFARRLAERPASGGTTPRGLAMVVEDLHDLDGPTLRFLAYLAGRLDGTPIAILGALRPGLAVEDPDALAALATAARVVRPPSLSAPDAVARTRAALPDATPRFCAACASASAGSPGLLDALLAELRRRRIVPGDAQAERVGEIVPHQVQTEVAAHLVRLPPDAQALARAVAGLGDPLSLDRACLAARLPEDAAPAAVDALVAAEVLAPGLPLSYTAPIVRRAVQASLTVGQRVALGRHLPGTERPAPSRVTGAGTDALTPSEQRVGELAAQGMTTREIAARLFVTTKTVEFHLRNVYRKLDVPSSRAELTKILGASGLTREPQERSAP